MAYEFFQKKVGALVNKANNGSANAISVEFKEDRENGKFFANCSDGVRFVGNVLSNKISVLWGSGHMAAVPV